MTGAMRLAAGGRIDRDRPLVFTFDERRYGGYGGDTLASALLANDVHLTARSFKYHRPRGIMAAGVEEPNALVGVGRGARALPNMRATEVELYDGLVAVSQNNWPSLRHDVGEVASVLSRFFPAGFYYKTFMWPSGAWRFYEFFIRRAAGLGRAPREADPDRYEKTYHHCDVLIVGGGPTGLAAAFAAGRTGARVTLIDDQPEFGGQLLSGPAEIDGQPALDWVRETEAALAKMEDVTLLRRTSVFGYFDHNYLGALEKVADHLAEPPPGLPRQRFWKIRARQVVLATGAIERPLVFANNDRPGIMLAGAVSTYVNRYAVRPGGRAVVFTNNDSAYGAARDLAQTGASVTVVDLREGATERGLPRQVFGLGIEVLPAHRIVATEGRLRVHSVDVAPIDGTGPGRRPRRIECDLLAVSGGFNPTVHLFSQAGGRLAYDEALAAFVPAQNGVGQRAVVAGAAHGRFALDRCLGDGEAAGIEAAKAAGVKGRRRARRRPSAKDLEETPMAPFWLVPGLRRAERGGKYFVDFQNDVTAADIGLAEREAYASVEHLKRYTTAGMGTDQGKTSNMAALALLAERRGETIANVGTTTFRPPYTPVSFGALAGRDIGETADPVRKTPMHGWHERQGAIFEDVGQWKRPFCYPAIGEDEAAAVRREATAVRTSLGILDASTLGKIDIVGPDAAAFLDRIYTNGWQTLKPGRCRYGLMLHEDGFVFDDGVTACLGENHYLMHTTTSGAATVLGWLENWLQTEWPDLRVYCTSVTEQFAVANIAGPNARALLAELTDDIDVTNDAFAHMSVRFGTVAGLPARVFRVSFTGETSYEINVPASYGLALWQALMTAGEPYAVTPFGTEALHVLRAEKGYIMVGQETDGTVTPFDLGMGGLVSTKKDFIGKRSLARPDIGRDDRKQLVGLLTEDPAIVLEEGVHVVESPGGTPPIAHLGHVTSSYDSPNVGRSIALALIKGGHARKGEILYVSNKGRDVPVTVADTTFFDPEGSRLDG